MTNEELVQLYQNGDKQALDKLIKQNRGIVNKLVNKFYTEGTNSIDREDLEQEGYMGLIAAASKYKSDIDNPAKFITYAIYWIYQKINRFIKYRSTNNETSLNTPIGENGDTELMDCIEGVDYSFENVEEQIYRQELRIELEEVMSKYNTLQGRNILKLNYGWDNNKCMTLNEIGEMLGVSGERARQLKSQALRKIRSSPWGREKIMKFYADERLIYEDSIPGTVESISFAQRYLYNEVV